MIRINAFILATLFLSALVAGAQAQEESIGAAEYAASCAACHGTNGKGFGPLANELSTEPADLTELRSRNGGEFPYYRVVATIDGRYVVPAMAIAICRFGVIAI